MSIKYIVEEVKRIQNKYGKKDPFTLCRAMNISLIFVSMGTDQEACKGFYLLQSRKQAIVINSDLSEELQRIILMHEIAHAVLHRKASGIKEFHDFTLFDKTSIYEYEANLFTADYFLDDDEVLALLDEGLSFFEAASRLHVLPELLDFKCRVLKQKGYKGIDPPIISRANFLKKI